MNTRSASGLALLALIAIASAADARTVVVAAPVGSPDVVHVAPPTGERAADRASILAALERVRPGGTVQFAAGTYLIGEIIRVPIPRVTLLGHAEGTVIRGCDPDAFPEYPAALLACHGFELSGANQTVRNLTFEYTWHGLFVGCCFPADAEALEANEPPQRIQPGGHLVEGNTFRYSPNGIRVIGESPEPTVIRNNTFLDVYHAIGVNGRTVHFLDNHISVRDPARVPISTHPGGAIGVTPFGRGTDHTSCADNVIARNRVEGHPDAIGIWTMAGTSCRNNIVRDNTILVRRVRFASPWFGIRFSDEADSTVVGVPLTLGNYLAASGRDSVPGQKAVMEDNLIEGNRILGAEGIGIEIRNASRNRIVNNTIAGIRTREPFPGNILDDPVRWREANGSGIWLSPGSDQNEIVGNIFEEIASYAIVLEGDRNRVETRSASDAVRDRGSGNRVGLAPSPEDPAEEVRSRTEAFFAALGDDSQGFVAHFFAEDAVLVLTGGAVLGGREAIVRDFLRPMTPRLRGVRPSIAETLPVDEGVEVTGTFLARFAPAPDTVEARFSATWSRPPGDESWQMIRASIELPETPDGGPIRSRFFHVDGRRLHYLDFGGAGVPVVFMPVGDRTAYSYIDYAARFSDRNRVLAITSRGTGESEGVMEDALGMVTAAHDVLALLDTLGIERAVVVPGWAAEIGVYLAEHHPHRLAGLVFPTGGPPPDLLALWAADPTGVLQMGGRLALSIGGADPDAALAGIARRRYVPEYLRTGGPIEVPALAFTAGSGTPGVEEWWIRDIRTAEWVAGNPANAPDPVARAFYLRLAEDEALQARVRAVYRDIVAPAHPEAAERFRHAFGEHLREVRLDVPVLSGYAYRDTPELIAPHVRRFLDDVAARERRRSTISTPR